MKARFPLLLLLGILFLASVSVCYGIVSHDKEDDDRRPWWPEPEREEEKHHQRTRGSEEGEKEERERHQEPGHRERARQEGEKEEDERQPWWQPGRGEEEGEWRGSRRLEDPDERERVRERTERAKKWRRETEERDTPRRPHHRESEEEEGSSSSSSESSRRSQRRNPFYFRSSSSRFQTRFQNEYGYVRVLQRFDERSKLFENLQNYRIFEFKAKPHTVVLPHHNDADSIVVILSGKAIITLVNPNDRESFNLERGDVLVHPAGTIAYVANHDDNENLRIAKIIIPVNRPGEFQAFYPSNTEPQESYLNGFSRNILEASFNAEYNEIERVLLRGGEQRQEQGLIVKVSRDLIQQLSRHAKSSSRKRTSSEPEPFNLRSRDPIYSNEFGKHFEINPNRNSQLRDFDIFLSSTEIREGSIFLPHYNSRSTVILVVNEGRGEFELVAQRKQQQQRRNEEDEEEEEEQPRIEAQRFRARLSPGDVVVIPAGHPVAINASSDLNFIAFGINAENNQRHFLAGGDDNVISQIEKVVKEIAFPGSAEDIERLIKNQRNSHFANAQPQQREEGGHGRRGPLSSILGAFTK